eukprot:1124446-Pleurochrysis_carterae.AAC.10
MRAVSWSRDICRALSRQQLGLDCDRLLCRILQSNMEADALEPHNHFFAVSVLLKRISDAEVAVILDACADPLACDASTCDVTGRMSGMWADRVPFNPCTRRESSALTPLSQISGNLVSFPTTHPTADYFDLYQCNWHLTTTTLTTTTTSGGIYSNINVIMTIDSKYAAAAEKFINKGRALVLEFKGNLKDILHFHEHKLHTILFDDELHPAV